jgi:solute carrier family 6 GABA transporter-like protein 1
MQCRLCFDVWCAVLGVDSEFCNVEALVTGIVDNWPDQLLKHRRKFTGKDDLHMFFLYNESVVHFAGC